jgi:tripartite ATP-independent transporter DctM subunit
MTLFLMLFGLFALIFINVPIAVALAVVAVVAMLLTQGVDILPNVALVMFDGATKFPLLAIPLFIFAGAIMNTTGISRRLITFASALFGFIKGGLAMVNVAASMFFAEMSGSAVADVAALGSILIPAMKKRGYPRGFAAAVTSSSATIAIIIPPSIPMILYAVMSDSSVVKLFVAGIIPGVLGGTLMMGVCYWFSVRYNYPVEETFKLKRLWTTFSDASWAFLLPLIILGGIFGGIVTATEGAGLAVAASLFIGGVIYRELNWDHLRKAIIEGGKSTAVVMLLVAASALVGNYLTERQVPQQLAQALFLHSAAAIILVVPIVMPLVNAVGIDPVHFGLIVTLNLGIGQQTPPVASVLITACSVAKADIWEVSRINVFFVAVIVMVLLLITYVPVIPMSLVRLFYG